MSKTAQQAGEADRLWRGYARILSRLWFWFLGCVLPESAAAYPQRWAGTSHHGNISDNIVY